MAPPKKDPVARFWSKVAAPNRTGCMLWTGGLNSYGYGQMSFGRGVNKGAHRVAYEMIHGSVPDGLHIDHLCKVRNCVNTAHMEAVTPAENTRRANELRRLDTLCRKGHAYTEATTYLYKGQRYCRICRATWQREKR